MRKTDGTNLGIRILATVGICAALLWMTSCASSGRQSDQQIQHQAQQATERAKIAADKAAAEARAAAANAARDANDVARGVRQGLHQPGTDAAAGLVNINTADRARLAQLPGVGAAGAQRIEANRPYKTPHDLVRKGALNENEYDRIAGDVVAH